MGAELYSEGNQLLREIVNYDKIPSGIQRFWNGIAGPGDRLQRWNDISVLNTMLKQEIPEGTDLMSLYEIFRDIFVMRASHKESLSIAAKTPRFTTFDCSFEQLAFLPEFWFDCAEKADRERGNGVLPLNPSRLLFSFERFMYNQEGGACWSAIDWGLPKYCFRVVCGSRTRPQLHVAALLLAAHSIATGRMGLYVGEKTDMSFSYAGISGTDGTGSPLLKYYHFDRFTGLSFIRKHELELDADRKSETAMFEPQWQCLAMLTEFVLQNSSARATKTACSRVCVSTFIRALNVLKGVNALGCFPVDGNQKAAAVLSRIENIVKRCRSMTPDERKTLLGRIDEEIDRLNFPDEDAENPMLKCLDRAIALLDSPSFATIDPHNLLGMIGAGEAEFIPADFYLAKQGIASAKDFWDKAEETFESIRSVYQTTYSKTVKRFTADERFLQNGGQFPGKDSEYLKKVLLNGEMDELRGRMNGLRLRSALRELLLEEQLELNCGQMDRILDLKFKDVSLALYFPQENHGCGLPCKWLTADVAPQKAGETLRAFCLELLSEFFRSRKTGKIVRDFTKSACFDQVQNASDKLWNIYFQKENEAACMDRWMLSLDQSIKILEGNDDKYESLALPAGEKRSRLLEANRKELSALSPDGGFDRGAALKRLSGFKGFSLEKVLPSNLRGVVVLDLIARLMVATADISPIDAMWRDEKMLKVFFFHLLYAVPQKTKRPLPFHIGIYSDTLLRGSRSGDDQRNNIDRLLKHRFDNGGERYLFLLMLVKYLKREDNPQRALKSVMDNPAMAEFASHERLIRLKTCL